MVDFFSKANILFDFAPINSKAVRLATIGFN
jgi:hypothetical protein